MKTMQILSGAALLATGLLLAGCVVRAAYVEERPVYRERVVYAEPAPPPGVVVVQEAPPPTEVVTVVYEAPPPVIVERIPPRPVTTYIWVGGYWTRHGPRWEWVRGRWCPPPYRGAVYVPPRWDRHGNEFHFSVGVWH